MNYLLHYDRLITRSSKTKPLNVYTEGHHIIPKCLGGIDEDNIVYLTPEEHYVAHQLLVKMNPEHRGLIFAAHMMTVDAHGSRANNKQYGWLRRKVGEAQRCKIVSKETRQRMSESSINRIHAPHSEERKRKISEALKGKKKSDEHCRKNSEARKGKTLSAEHRSNIGKSQVGKIRSVETRKRISEALKGKKKKDRVLKETTSNTR